MLVQEAVIKGVTYRKRDKVRYTNCYGQTMEGVVEDIWVPDAGGSTLLLVKRPGWYAINYLNPMAYESFEVMKE